MILYHFFGHDRGYDIISEARHILYLRILYPIHIQAQKKDMDIYPISFVKIIASIVTIISYGTKAV
jgi:hypothetical protein